MSHLVALALAGCALGASQRPDAPDEQIPTELVRPEGAGPFSAVVYLHSCAGVSRAGQHVRDWSRRLVGMGYLVAIPDSFTSRHHPNGVCGHGMRVPPWLRADDAYATLRRLEERGDVRPDRIGVIGYSHGGWSVLAALDQGVARRARAAAHTQHGFAAAIAYYPDCAHGEWLTGFRTSAPLLILAGELDDWTPSAPCQQLAEETRRQGQAVFFKLYPGAHHGFDTSAPLRRVPEARQGRGAMIGGHPAAREDSIQQVAAFFGRYLQGSPAGPAEK